MTRAVTTQILRCHAMDTLQSGLHGGAGHGVLGSPFLGLANPLAAYGNPGLSAASMSGLAGFTLGGGAGSPFGQSGLRFATNAPGGGGGMSGGGGPSGLGALGVNGQHQVRHLNMFHNFELFASASCFSFQTFLNIHSC